MAGDPPNTTTTSFGPTILADARLLKGTCAVQTGLGAPRFHPKHRGRGRHTIGGRGGAMHFGPGAPGSEGVRPIFDDVRGNRQLAFVEAQGSLMTGPKTINSFVSPVLGLCDTWFVSR